jgi:hypothetical protein
MLLFTSYKTLNTLIEKCASTTFLISFVIIVVFCLDFWQALKSGKLIVPEAIYVATVTVYGAKSTVKTLWPNGKNGAGNATYEDSTSGASTPQLVGTDEQGSAFQATYASHAHKTAMGLSGPPTEQAVGEVAGENVG